MVQLQPSWISGSTLPLAQRPLWVLGRTAGRLLITLWKSCTQENWPGEKYFLFVLLCTWLKPSSLLLVLILIPDL